MKVKLIKNKDPNILKFVLSKSYVELANALRRSLISDVPVMAIDEVHFSKNNSALYNEVLALRLGLLPLTSDAETYNPRSECSCKGAGCAKCTAKFSLEVKGPGMVYARDLKPTDDKVKPVNPDTPLVKLFEDQGLRLEADAVIGFGRDHAKFNSCMASYQYYPSIRTGGCKCKEALQACPRSVYDLKYNKLNVKNLESCNLCMACVDACSCNKLKVEGREDKFIFRVESWGQYEPKKIVKLAIKSLKERADELGSELK